jgi:hypothetical protein
MPLLSTLPVSPSASALVPAIPHSPSIFRFVAWTNNCGSATSNEATYTICPADFSCDGRLNSADFFDFVRAFFSDVQAADFNRDSIINSQDFFDFLAAFFVGC